MAQPDIQEDALAAVLRNRNKIEVEKPNSKIHSWKLGALCVLIAHVTTRASKRKWSAWKRLYKAERAAITLDKFQEHMVIAENYNGNKVVLGCDPLLAVDSVCSKP